MELYESRLLTAFREVPDFRLVAAGDTSIWLAAARIYTSLYRLCIVSESSCPIGTASAYTLLSSRLFEVILQRLSCSGQLLSERVRLTDALYVLARETGRSYEPGLADVCDTCVFEVLRDWNPDVNGMDDAATEIAICSLLESFFYPEAWESDSWFAFLRSALQGWCDTLSPDGLWAGLSSELSWQRVAVLNRYSYLFRDSSYDRETVCAFQGQLTLLSQQEGVPSLLDACLEACLPGHLCALPQSLEGWLSGELQKQMQNLSADSGERLMVLSDELAFLCAVLLVRKSRRRGGQEPSFLRTRATVV